MKRLYCFLLLLIHSHFSNSQEQAEFSMLDNKYQLNRETQLDNDYSAEINHFWESSAQIKTFSSQHGGTINTLHIKTGQPNAIVISQGRNESVLKYKELAFDLHKQGYDIFLIDHRGQGFSTRLGGDADRGHVEKFSHYVDDFHFFVESLQLTKNYQSRFLLSHSMGGAISALYLQQQQHPFNKAAFFSPMFSVNLYQIPTFIVKIITYISDKICHWFNRIPCYAPKSMRYTPIAFEDNQLTSSKKRYHSAFHTFEQVIETQLGGPTMHWLNESLYATEKLIKNANLINIPIIIIRSGADSIVTEKGQQAFYHQLSNRTKHALIEIIDAKHELLLEQDKYRIPALTAMLDFFKTNKYEGIKCTK